MLAVELVEMAEPLGHLLQHIDQERRHVGPVQFVLITVIIDYAQIAVGHALYDFPCLFGGQVFHLCIDREDASFGPLVGIGQKAEQLALSGRESEIWLVELFHCVQSIIGPAKVQQIGETCKW